MNFFKNIFRKKNQLKYSTENNKNKGMELIDLVYSLYDYRINRENLINPKLFKNIRVKGKNIEHKIDIYIEFVQMNNLEKTVIKIIDNKIVKAEDVWQFDNLLKDLGCFPKGVLYYNDKIDEEALNIANDKQIQTIFFDVMGETRINVFKSISEVLPDENVIGDPFWTLMQIDERTKIIREIILLKEILYHFTHQKNLPMHAVNNKKIMLYLVFHNVI